MAATSFQQVTAMLVELNPQIFKKEVFCISSKGFNQRDAYRVMLRKYPDVMNIEQMCDALRISTKTGYKLLHKGKIPAMKIGRSYRIPKAHLFTYGLRRSEVVGLKWAAVDFEQNTIEICHTVTTVRLDGKEVLVESNDTKTKSSKRTLPLVPVFRERLLALQEEQKENRKLCGRCYNKKYADYICVDAMGNLLKPDYLSNSFQIILQNYHLRRIRFHDLRHSCASLLLANGVPMKMIQEWLGHSDFSTTANIYSHLDYASKVSSAEAMLNGLGMGSNPENDT